MLAAAKSNASRALRNAGADVSAGAGFVEREASAAVRAAENAKYAPDFWVALAMLLATYVVLMVLAATRSGLLAGILTLVWLVVLVLLLVTQHCVRSGDCGALTWVYVALYAAVFLAVLAVAMSRICDERNRRFYGNYPYRGGNNVIDNNNNDYKNQYYNDRNRGGFYNNGYNYYNNNGGRRSWWGWFVGDRSYRYGGGYGYNNGYNINNINNGGCQQRDQQNNNDSNNTTASSNDATNGSGSTDSQGSTKQHQ